MFLRSLGLFLFFLVSLENDPLNVFPAFCGNRMGYVFMFALAPIEIQRLPALARRGRQVGAALIAVP